MKEKHLLAREIKREREYASYIIFCSRERDYSTSLKENGKSDVVCFLINISIREKSREKKMLKRFAFLLNFSFLANHFGI